MTGGTQNVAVKLGVATVTETLVVTADAATVDTASSATNTNLDSDYLQNLPTARFQPEVLNLAPGINQDVAYGSAASGLAYQLDGVDTSDPEGGTAWSFVNYNIVEEVQLVGLGAPAEYGSFTGVVFNSVTKSGGNQFKGLVDTYYSNESLSDSFTGEEFAGLNPTNQVVHRHHRADRRSARPGQALVLRFRPVLQGGELGRRPDPHRGIASPLRQALLAGQREEQHRGLDRVGPLRHHRPRS